MKSQNSHILNQKSKENRLEIRDDIAEIADFVFNIGKGQFDR